MAILVSSALIRMNVKTRDNLRSQKTSTQFEEGRGCPGKRGQPLFFLAHEALRPEVQDIYVIHT